MILTTNQLNLKTKLLNTGCFIDNNFLDEYVILCSESTSIPEFTNVEQHHVIPFSYFTEKLNITTKSEKQKLRRACKRKESPEFNLITANNIVYITFAQHCLAHFYLYKCTIGKLKYANETAFLNMTARQSKLLKLNSVDKKQIINFISTIHNDTESQSYQLALITDAVLKLYKDGGYKKCLEYLKNEYNIETTKENIKAKAKFLNIKSANYTEAWTDAQLQIVIDYYPIGGYKLCMEKLNYTRSKNAIQTRARYLGLAGPGANKVKDGWSQFELETLDTYYPIGGWKLVQQKLTNRSAQAIRHQANKRGITVIKNKETIKHDKNK